MKRIALSFMVFYGVLCAPSIAEEQPRQIETMLEQMRLEIDNLRDKQRQISAEIEALSERYSELLELTEQGEALSESVAPSPEKALEGALEKPLESATADSKRHTFDEAFDDAGDDEASDAEADDAARDESSQPPQQSTQRQVRQPAQTVPPLTISPRNSRSIQTAAGLAYQEAMQYLYQGQTEQLRDALIDFLAQYRREGTYSGQANYWIGVSYYEEGDNDEAMIYFAEVVNRFSDSPKYEDALLKQGEIYTRTGNIDEAVVTFEKLLSSDNRRVRNLAQTRLGKLTGNER